MLKYVARFTGKKSIGELRWDGDAYAAVSGPEGEGTLPIGKYFVRKTIADSDVDESYCIVGSSGKTCFFIILEAKFQTYRTGFGIHPMGDKIGLDGCVALDPAAAPSFWSKWKRTKVSNRPKEMTVEQIKTSRKNLNGGLESALPRKRAARPSG